MNATIYITLAVALAHHLGLCRAVAGRVARWRVPFRRSVAEIIGCAKCLTFWTTLVPAISEDGVAEGVVVSLLCAYAVRWLTLALAIIETKYVEIWERNAKE